MAPLQDPRLVLRDFPVFSGEDFVVTFGANEGDVFGLADDHVLGDQYRLRSTADMKRLAIRWNENAWFLSSHTEAGQTGNRVRTDAVVTLMDANSRVTELISFQELDEDGKSQKMHLLPLAPLQQKRDYTLLRIDAVGADQKLAQTARISVARGTKIMTGSSRPCAVEDLCAGDEILTRDNGVQPLRWLGHSTERAIGRFAPVRIAAGTLDNDSDLIVSPDQTMFFYQHGRRLAADRKEFGAKARQLVNGQNVTVQEGGFVDYYQLLFDQQEIIFAEGVAISSMHSDGSVHHRAPLPQNETTSLWSMNQTAALEPGRAQAAPEAAPILRRATRA